MKRLGYVLKQNRGDRFAALRVALGAPIGARAGYRQKTFAHNAESRFDFLPHLGGENVGALQDAEGKFIFVGLRALTLGLLDCEVQTLDVAHATTGFVAQMRQHQLSTFVLIVTGLAALKKACSLIRFDGRSRAEKMRCESLLCDFWQPTPLCFFKKFFRRETLCV